VVADIPGLIEGASEGAGLGTRFLGHVERTAVLIHLVDATQDDVAQAWRTVRQELEAYGEGLAGKPEILALNKVDALDEAARGEKAAALEAAAGVAPRLVSGVSGEGVTELLREAYALVRRNRAELGEQEQTAHPAEDDAAEGWAP
jgi:GTP-binding protein